MKKLNLLAGALVFSLTSLNGCAVTPPPVQTSTQPGKVAVQPIHNPPQVIYRIDKNRYLTLEDYSNCDDGSIYYHNDNKKIKTKLWFLSKGTMNYQGKFIWAAKNDDMLAIPLVSGDNDACGDSLRGCAYSILSASNDGGKKFSDIKFRASDSSASKDYTIVISDNAIYIKSINYNADKYVNNNDGVFIQPRELSINNIFYKKLLAMGIPDDVLDKSNPLDVNGSLLSTKYSYSNEQLSDLGNKVSTLYYDIRDNTPQDTIPKLMPFPHSTTQFTCNAAMVPSQLTNQG
ncbi:T6SS immunity protein Tli3 family protein [Rahnella perminowiae]|uniref:T6SS immunity protein Tli3 family protein n=1 Tax=Rahnella perminowiae TaxID=2816244 RepID=UPI00300EE35A